MEQKKASTDFIWMAGILLLAGMLFFVRGLAWLVPTVILPLSILLLVSYWWKNRRSQPATATDEGTRELQALIANCDQALTELRSQAERTSQSSNELQIKLKQATNLEAKLRDETAMLVERYAAQAKVITSKLSFYEEMKARIEQLLTNHQWKMKLQEKKQELEGLQADHYEQLEKMESIKQDVAYSTGFFSAIRQLSDDIDNSSSSLDIDQLKKELEQLLPEQH